MKEKVTTEARWKITVFYMQTVNSTVYSVMQWFLTRVRSNPWGSTKLFQGFRANVL